MSVRELIFPALFYSHIGIILIRQYLTGNDSGASSKVVVSAESLAVRSGGGLFSSLGVWPLMMGAGLGYCFCMMVQSQSAGLPTDLFVSLVAAMIGTFACVLLGIGISALFDRRTAAVDRNGNHVMITRRLIVPLTRREYSISQFEKIAVYPLQVSRGRRGAKTIFKVELAGPRESVAIDCAEILEYDVAIRVARATERITHLPIEISSNAVIAPDPISGLIVGFVIMTSFTVMFFFVGSLLFITLGDRRGSNPLSQIATALFFGVVGGGTCFTAWWMCVRELWGRLRQLR